MMILNTLKTILFLSMLTSLLLLVGYAIGGMSGLNIALFMSIIINVTTYFFSETLILTIYRAKPLNREEYAWIYQTVQELSMIMDIPEPKLWIVSNAQPNAFATGRTPHHASVVLTSGIIELLDKRELRGVLAHELSHIRNYDVLVATIAATIATAISYLTQFAYYRLMWSGENRRKNVFDFLLMFIVILITPFIAALIQYAISRTREYLADDSGAHASQDPLSLASALEKIGSHTIIHHDKAPSMQERTTASLCIVYPFTADSWILSLLSTHPPIEKRIEKLQQLARTMR
ncbi:MAG: M48 family metalloprotease [Candidatus Babeliales bacterium]